ncbi:phage portal family protein [Deminuibacter soli]|uniref:Phage portal protein n=1 Tax=Deminuibacter soli TaxID=2291815 RepID=A0A3E1NQ21_9BACT|nr:hypothetical protein [Deminuibacter soli]RFM30022.1 hypothetical protein DXN05_03355 [Deminuibacter soli]
MLEEKKQNKQQRVEFTVRNEVRLDPKDPIPIRFSGDSFKVVQGRKYIPFMGGKDNMPNLLLEARMTSVTQNACIESIARSTVGKGLLVRDVESPNPGLLEWMRSVNNKRESFNEVLKNIVDGERTQGNQFIEIVLGQVNGKKYMKVHLHSMLFCRLNEPDDFSEPTAVVISKQLAKQRYQMIPENARQIPLWSDNPLDKPWLEENGEKRTMLHFKNKVSGMEHYGLPASVSGLRHQVLEGKSAQYNIDNFDNNMILGGMLIFKSSMTQEEAQKNAKEIMMSHIGEGKTGRIAVISSEQGLNDVEFKPYNTQQEGSFIEFDKHVQEKIIAANNWDALLAGFTRTGSLGTGSAYIRSIYDVKEATLLNPLRTELLEKVVRPIMQIYAEWFGAKDVLEYEFFFQSAMPFSFMGDIDPGSFMQVNEARELAGLAPDESKDGVYLAEVKPAANKTNKDVPTEPAPEKGADNN